MTTDKVILGYFRSWDWHLPYFSTFQLASLDLATYFTVLVTAQAYSPYAFLSQVKTTYARFQEYLHIFMSASVQHNPESCNILILGVRTAAQKSRVISCCLTQLGTLCYLSCLFF